MYTIKSYNGWIYRSHQSIINGGYTQKHDMNHRITIYLYYIYQLHCGERSGPELRALKEADWNFIIWLFFLWRLLLRDWPHWHCTENHPLLKREASMQRPPPTTMMYIPTRLSLWLHACISRHFWWQSSIVAFIPISELVMSAPTRVSV